MFFGNICFVLVCKTIYKYDLRKALKKKNIKLIKVTHFEIVYLNNVLNYVKL